MSGRFKLGKVAIIGRGKVGRALAEKLRPLLGRDLSLVRGRGRAPLRADTVLLAVPDGSLAHVALTLADPSLLTKALLTKGKLRRAPVVLHLSGLRDAAVLAPLEASGVVIGAMHPLVSFADRKHPPKLVGATVVISGKRPARLAAERLAVLLSMRVIARPTGALQGPRYHAAAALLANGAVALATESSRVLEGLGVPRRARERALAGLLRSVADNVEHVGLPKALTGPVVRGDASAVALHLSALAPKERAAYVDVTARILAVAIEGGLAPAPARAIAALLRKGRR